MRKNNFSLVFGLFTIVFLVISCSGAENERSKEDGKLSSNLSSSDSLWIDFVGLMESKDIEALIQKSLDTIRCTDCIPNINENDDFESGIIFREYLRELMHLDSLGSKEFSSEVVEDKIIVNFPVDWKYAEERGYNLIFEFIRVDKDYKFKGMFTVP